MNYNRTDDECRAFLARGLPHYHKVRLNAATMTPGRVDRNAEFDYVGLTPNDFKGKRVLDIGALDGVHSFNAERSGAAHVLAIDVEDVDRYDWGHEGPPSNLRGKGEIKNRIFKELHAFFGSGIERKAKSVYELDPSEDGRFEIVLFYGVLYHLRHPLLSFDRIRAVSSGALIVETHVCNVDPQVPSSLFYVDDVLDAAVTNWCGPSEACVVSWMRDSGFKTIWAERIPRMVSRQRFIGFVDSPNFKVNSDKFFQCDAAYFAATRRAVEHQLAVGTFGKRPW